MRDKGLISGGVYAYEFIHHFSERFSHILLIYPRLEQGLVKKVFNSQFLCHAVLMNEIVRHFH